MSVIPTRISPRRIRDLEIDDLTAGTILSQNVYIGSTSFELSGGNVYLLIKDTQGTPVTRIKLGKTGAGATDYGLKIWGSDGSLQWDLTGATTAGIQNNAVTGSNIWGDATAVSTTSANWTDIGSVAITALGSLPIVAWAKLEVGVSGGAAGEYRILHNESSTQVDFNAHGSGDSYYRGSPLIGLYTPGSAGTATFKLQMRVSNGMGTVFARNNKLVIMELKR